MQDPKITQAKISLKKIYQYIGKESVMSAEDINFLSRFTDKIILILKDKNRNKNRDTNFVFFYIMIPNWFGELFRELMVCYLCTKHDDENLKNTLKKWLPSDINMHDGLISGIVMTQNIHDDFTLGWLDSYKYYAPVNKNTGNLNRNLVAHNLTNYYKRLKDSETYDIHQTHFCNLITFFEEFITLIQKSKKVK